MILVEGADGSGKTTLIQQLNKYWPSVRIEKGCESALQLQCEFAQSTAPIILDRSFITDIVYRLVFGGETDGMNIYDIANLLRKSVVIYCKTKTQYDDAVNRGEDVVTDLATSRKISKYYDAVMTFINTRTNTFVIDYDWHTDDVEELAKNIKEIINGI